MVGGGADYGNNYDIPVYLATTIMCVRKPLATQYIPDTTYTDQILLPTCVSTS